MHLWNDEYETLFIAMKSIKLILFLFCSSAIYAQNLQPSAVNLLPQNHGVFSISVLDANNVWAVCGNFDNTSPVSITDTVSIVKTSDGGATWQVQKISNFPGHYPLDMFVLNDDTAFVALNTFGNGSRTVKTTDGGNTWSTATMGTASGIWVKFFNDFDGVIINSGIAATTNDGGTTWQNVPSANIPAFQAGEFNSISTGNNSCVLVGNSIWFGTNKGRIFRSTDKGYNWTATASGLGANAVMSSVAFKDSLNGVALDCCSSSSAGITTTTDGGQTWTPQTVSTPLKLDNLDFVEGTSNTLIGTCDWFTSYNNRRAAYSNDFGITWTIVNSNIPFGGMEFISPTIGFIGSVEFAAPVAHDTLIYKWDPNVILGVNDMGLDNDVIAYPNPVDEILYLDLSKYEHTPIRKLEVYSTSGALVEVMTPVSAKNHQLDLSHLEPGLYEFVLYSNEGRVVKRVVKSQ